MRYKRIFGISFGLAMIVFGIFVPYFMGTDKTAEKITVIAIMAVCGAATAVLSAFGIMFCKKTSFFGAGMAAFGVMTIICAIARLSCALGGLSMYPVRIPAYEFGTVLGFSGFVTMAVLYFVYRSKDPGFLKVLTDAGTSFMLVPAFFVMESYALTVIEFVV